MQNYIRWLVLACATWTSVVRADAQSASSELWYVREPVRAGFQNWAAADAVAERMTQAGLNTLLYAWNDWREPVDPENGDYTIRVMDVPMQSFLRWPALAKKHRLHLVRLAGRRDGVGRIGAGQADSG